MTDESVRERSEAAAQAISDAREMVRVLDHHAAELAAALANYRSHHQWDAELRRREAAVLAREDRATVREREIEEALRKMEVKA